MPILQQVFGAILLIANIAGVYFVLALLTALDTTPLF